MPLEQLLDPRHVRAAVDAIDDTVVDHEHKRRDVLDREFLEQARVVVRVHAPDPQPVALLALDVSEEALHATRGPEVERVKKTSMGSGAWSTASSSPVRERTKLHSAPHVRALADRHRRRDRCGPGPRCGGRIRALRPRAVFAAAVALVGGGLIGWLVFDWKAGVAGAVAGALSGFGAGTFARGAVRRGGTSGGTAAIFVAAAVLSFALSFIPIVGFVEAIAIPVVGLRSRQRADEKYAGLRTLAK